MKVSALTVWALAGMASILMSGGVAHAKTTDDCATLGEAEFVLVKGVLPPAPQRQAPPLEPTVGADQDDEGGSAPPETERSEERRAEGGTQEARRRTRPLQPRGRRDNENRRRSLPDSVLIERPPSI